MKRHIREDFEQWFEHEFMNGLDGPGEWDEDRNCYVIFQVHMAFKGWCASRKFALGQFGIEEADDMEDFVNKVKARVAEEQP